MISKAEPAEAKELATFLDREWDKAAATLGQVDCAYYRDRLGKIFNVAAMSAAK
jgi:hypothetical protein